MEIHFDKYMQEHLADIKGATDTELKLKSLDFAENTVNHYAKWLSKESRQKAAEVLSSNVIKLVDVETDNESVLGAFQNYLPEEDFVRFVSRNLNSINDTDLVSEKNVYLEEIKILITNFRKSLKQQVDNGVKKISVA